MTTIGIRRARKKDVNAIYWLRRLTFELTEGPRLGRVAIERLRRENTHATLLEKMQEREMFCLYKRTNSKETLLGTVDIEEDKVGGLFVRWDYLGKGCGSTLLKFIERYAQAKGVKRLRLKSTEYAEHFYLKQGYTPIKCLEMEKTL